MNATSRALMIICIISLALIPAEAKNAQDASQKLFYILNYRISHCNAEIELNGVNIARSEEQYSYSGTGVADVGMWICPGKNIISVTIRPINKGKDDDSNPAVELSLSIARQGQMSDQGIKILTIAIPDKKGANPLADLKKPLRRDLAFAPSYIPPSELWGKIKKVRLDAAARRDILKLAADYHAAYVNKDAESLYGLLIFAAVDVARLRHQPVDDVRSKMKDALKEMMGDKDFVMEPLNLKSIVLKPVAGGRIIWVTDPSVESPIRTRPQKDSGAYSFPLYVSLIDGKWTIVR